MWRKLMMGMMVFAGGLTYGAVSLGLDGQYVMWWPGVAVLDTSNGWKQAVLGAASFFSYGGHLEYALDDTWTLFGRVTVTRGALSWLSVGELNLRWYGDTPAPAGVSVGAGLMYLQLGPYVSLFPQVLASYKWMFAGHAYLEPEVMVFPLYADMYLGIRFSIGAGYVF